MTHDGGGRWAADGRGVAVAFPRVAKPLLVSEAAASGASRANVGEKRSRLGSGAALRPITDAPWEITPAARRKQVELMREVVQGRGCSCATAFVTRCRLLLGAAHASPTSEQTRSLPLRARRISRRYASTTKTCASCPEVCPRACLRGRFLQSDAFLAQPKLQHNQLSSCLCLFVFKITLNRIDTPVWDERARLLVES